MEADWENPRPLVLTVELGSSGQQPVNEKSRLDGTWSPPPVTSELATC